MKTIFFLLLAVATGMATLAMAERFPAWEIEIKLMGGIVFFGFALPAGMSVRRR